MRTRVLAWIIGIGLALTPILLWELWTRHAGRSALFPPPSGSVPALHALLADAQNRPHILATLAEVGSACFIGMPAGAAAAFLTTRAELFSGLLRPGIIALSLQPVTALTPLLILWIGSPFELGASLVAAYAAFFPVFIGLSGNLAVDGRTGETPARLSALLADPAAIRRSMDILRMALRVAVPAAILSEMSLGTSGFSYLANNYREFMMVEPLVAVAVLTLLIIATADIALILLGAALASRARRERAAIDA